MFLTSLILATVAHGEDITLLNELQHRAVNFFWEQSNSKTGFTKDRASNYGTDKYDVSSSAATGFALAAYPIGVERGWLKKKDALQRTRLTLKSLLAVHAKEHGWYYHFVNWETGERVWNCELSSIDTSILLAGVWQARQYWKDATVTKAADDLTERIDWSFMMRDVNGKQPHEFFSMGWTPEKGWIKATWAGYCELLMLYIQAYGASEVRSDGWDKITRKVATYKGHEYLEGGPLFMHQMSNGFYPFGDYRDRQGYSYWVSTKECTLANRQYCIDQASKYQYSSGFWGLSACDGPDGYDAFGGPPRTSDNGTVTPTSAIASMPYTPVESIEAAKSMMKNYAYAYGKYGFSNGINPSRKWKGPDVLGIDLGMMLLGIEDYRTGLPWKLSMSHPFVKRGYNRAGLKISKTARNGPLQQK